MCNRLKTRIPDRTPGARKRSRWECRRPTARCWGALSSQETWKWAQGTRRSLRGRSTECCHRWSARAAPSGPKCSAPAPWLQTPRKWAEERCPSSWTWGWSFCWETSAWGRRWTWRRTGLLLVKSNFLYFLAIFLFLTFCFIFAYFSFYVICNELLVH